MKKHGKKYNAAAEKIEPGRKYNLEEAVAKVKDVAFAKFDETVELTVWLGVDPRKADQLVRGTLVLPHGLGKSKKVLVIAQGEKIKEAEEAGADFVGGEDMVNKIKEGWLDFDAVVSTPDMMRLLSRLGKKLGARMPNAKSGTVGPDLGRIVGDRKKGQIEYRNEPKASVVHSIIGKSSFESVALAENANALIGALQKAKPSAAKGTYLKSITLSSTMGPGVKVDPASVR